VTWEPSFVSQVAKVEGANISDQDKIAHPQREPAPPVDANAAEERLQGMIIDTNVYLSRWPFRRLPGDEPEALVAKLRQRNVVQAWAGSFDGLLASRHCRCKHPARQACRAYARALLVPIGFHQSQASRLAGRRATLPGSAQDAGIRLHPNYHGYGLGDLAFMELLSWQPPAG